MANDSRNRTVADDASAFDAQLYAGMVQGGFQAHAGVDPAEALARREEAAADDLAEEKIVRIEAFYRLMEYFFADGWEPVALIRRVYCVARERFPELLAGVPGADVRVVCDDDSGVKRFEVVYRRLIVNWKRSEMGKARLLTWYKLTKDYKGQAELNLDEKPEGQDVVLARVTNMMAVIYSDYSRLQGEKCESHVSLYGLLHVENDTEWDVVRLDVFSKLMAMFFADGGESMKVVRRVYVIAKALKPSLIAKMSLERMAWMCGDGGRATQEARVKRCYNAIVEMLSARGSGCVKASFQKSASASASYSRAQQGNTNRRGRGTSQARGKVKRRK